jgi:hypothetical protein
LSTGEKAAIIGGAAAAGAIIFATRGGGPSVNKLWQEGPQLPSSFNFSRLTLHCFVRGNWPLFIAYELERPGRVTLAIKADGADTFTHRLDGTPGEHEELITLPASFGDQPKVAAYQIEAVTDDPRKPRPVPFRLYTLGVGDQAVGSAGIDQLIFQPGQVRANQPASYGFHSLFNFNRATADFMRQERGKDGEIHAKLVSRQKFERGIPANGRIDRQWDCKEGKKPSLGVHQLLVRGWRSVGGDWVTAWSKQVVRVEK